MKNLHSPATMMWIAGTLGLAISGCSSSDIVAPGTGGTSSPPAGSGGLTGTGGAAGATVGTGGSGSGGMASTGAGGQGSGGTAGMTIPGAGGSAGATGAAGATGPAGGMEAGGRGTGGATAVGGASGAAGVTGAGGKSTGGSTGSPGTCTTSKDAGKTASGSGSHKVVIETNSDPGIKCGTIYRPADLGGAEKYPIFVWGEGSCAQKGLDNQAAMSEIASHGYFIVADGTPGSGACAGGQDGKAFLDYITWAIAENDKPCSAYYQSLDTTKVAADGFSCGGLMAENVSGDPRFTAIGITSSGLFNADPTLYKKIHTPFKILLGGTADMAYSNGERDYDQISLLGIPIILFSKDGAGHGGDLGNAKGDFNTVNLAWLNWQLKGDTGATGRGLLDGATCKYCTASGWEYKSKNLQ